MSEEAKTRSRRGRPVPSRSTAEWFTFSVASVILLCVLAAIASLWLGGTRDQPVFSVRTVEVRQARDGYHLRVEVHNGGDHTAEAVQVVAEATFGEGDTEEGEQEIDFLSGGEREEVEFVFGRDPRDGDLEVGVASYKVP